MMRLGDVLEWAACACVATAAGLWHGAEPTLVVVGLFLAYEAQCYSSHPVELPRLRRKRNQVTK